MKTHDELLEAMRAVHKEAYESGFTFCAAIASNDSPSITTYVICGESLKLFGLTVVIQSGVSAQNGFVDI